MNVLLIKIISFSFFPQILLHQMFTFFYIFLNLIHFFILSSNSILSIVSLEQRQFFRLISSIAYYITLSIKAWIWSHSNKYCSLTRRNRIIQSNIFYGTWKPISFVKFGITWAGNLFILLCPITLLLIDNDVELNPGPKKTKSCYNFSFCYWNLNITIAHNFL